MSSKPKNAGASAPVDTTAPAPANSMLDLFKPVEGEVDNTSKLDRKNLPPIIKLDQVPIGSAVQGTVIKVVDSPTSEIQGKLLWLNYKNTDFCFPVTGAIRSALCPGLKDAAKVETKLKTEIGNFFYAKRMPNKPAKGNKTLMVFDVRTGKV